MDLMQLTRKSEWEWQIPPFGKMRVPGIIYASEALVREIDMKVYEQVTNVATLPGIVKASPCRMLIGATAFQSEGSPPSILMKEG